MPKRITFDLVQRAFKEKGFTLISGECEFENARSKLRYTCPQHPDKEQKIHYTDLMRTKHGCRLCGFEQGSSQRKEDFEIVQKAFSDRGLILLSTDYIHSELPLKYHCPRHPDKDLETTYHSLKRTKYGCPYCAGKGQPSIEEVEREFNKRGLILLDKVYLNYTTKMEYICPKHPEKNLAISLSDLKPSVFGCPYCAGVGRPTIEEIRSEFNKRGYELLTNTYKTSKQKLRYRCPNHPNKKLSISLVNFRTGSGCPFCAGVGRQTYGEVRDMFYGYGFDLLEKNYQNTSLPMKFRCQKHPQYEQSTTISNLKCSGVGVCIKCKRHQGYTFEEVKTSFHERGYELLEEKYVNIDTKMRYRCSQHPEKTTSITFYELTSMNHGCPYCAKNGKPSIEEVRERFKIRGYTLLDDTYFNSKQLLRYICPKHPDKELKVMWNNFNHHNHGCPYCANERMTGDTHPNWKGGVTSLDRYLRHFLKVWITEILRNNNYTCFISNQKGVKLHVHHIENFTSIRDKMLKDINLTIRPQISDYTRDELMAMALKIKEYHSLNVGVPLREDIHYHFHGIYGNQINTYEQLLEYKQRYLSGEFNDILKEELKIGGIYQ